MIKVLSAGGYWTLLCAGGDELGTCSGLLACQHHNIIALVQSRTVDSEPRSMELPYHRRSGQEFRFFSNTGNKNVFCVFFSPPCSRLSARHQISKCFISVRFQIDILIESWSATWKLYRLDWYNRLFSWNKKKIKSGASSMHKDHAWSHRQANEWQQNK